MNLDQLNNVGKAYEMNEKRKKLQKKHANKAKVGVFLLLATLSIVLIRKIKKKK